MCKRWGLHSCMMNIKALLLFNFKNGCHVPNSNSIAAMNQHTPSLPVFIFIVVVAIHGISSSSARAPRCPCVLCLGNYIIHQQMSLHESMFVRQLLQAFPIVHTCLCLRRSARSRFNTFSWIAGMTVCLVGWIASILPSDCSIEK